MIVFSLVAGGTSDLWIRLRAGFADAFSTSYVYSGFDHSTSGASLTNKGDSNATQWPINFQLTTGNEAAGEILIFDPANSSRTRMISRTVSMNGSGSVSQCEMTGIFKTAGGYDGFSIIQSTATIPAGGYCRVYGMRRA